MTKKKRDLTACILVFAGVLCITFGIVRNEPDKVLQKAVRICLECVGIG